MSNLVHEFIEDWLKLYRLVEFFPWEWRRKEDKRSEVESISIEVSIGSPPSHTNAVHQGIVLGLLHEVLQLVPAVSYKCRASRHSPWPSPRGPPAGPEGWVAAQRTPSRTFSRSWCLC